MSLKFLESVWISFIISFMLVLVICIIVKFNVGPNNMIDDFLDLINGSKKQTWVFLVAGSKGFDNYRHQVQETKIFMQKLKMLYTKITK